MEMKSCCRCFQISRRWSLMTKLSILFIVILLQGLSHDVEALKMNRVVMPQPIENGSQPAVIIDCDYNYDPNVDTTGFVLKWYYNSLPTPVYQWIPPETPQALGSLYGRLDLAHRVTNDNYTMHRALRILTPTVELAGNYKCQVSSTSGEVEADRDLVVYVPASKVEINYTKPTETSVNVTCHVEGMYPKPDATMLLYREELDENPRKIEEAEHKAQKVHDGEGVFAAILYNVFEDSTLSRESHFECVFAIPNADYEIRQRITYYPDPRSIGDNNSGIMTRSHFLYGLAAIISLTISRFLVQLS